MAKTKVTEQQYLNLINDKMKEHAYYRPGMYIKLNAINSNNPLGVTIMGGEEARAIAAWAARMVRQEYEL